MGNEGRLTQGVTCKQWVMKQRRAIIHTRSYNANNE
ncbi:hypothetical protein KSS87_011585 [Heliosperma pusillum]|nr:hypothetical protein KSS87_011585 [Heliosperma pusillum]